MRPKTCRQWRRCIGIIRAASSALKFAPGEAAAFIDLMAVLDEACKTGKGSDKCWQVMEEIASHIADVDWHYMDADWLATK